MIEHSYEDELLKIIINNEIFFFNSRLNLNIFLDSLNKHIVYTIKDHYDKYNNFDFTEIVYELQDNEQALNKYMVLHDEPCNKKSFEFFLEKTEEQYKIYKIKNLTKKVTEGSIEFENYISQINDISLEKNKNTSLEPNDIMEMITSNAEKLVFHKSYFYADMVQPIKHTVNIIGARTGVGKTALALNLLLDLSIEYKCLYINLELNESEIYKRLVSILSKVPIYRLGSLTNEEENYVSDKVYELKKRNLKIIQNCNTISKIKNLVASELIISHKNEPSFRTLCTTVSD